MQSQCYNAFSPFAVVITQLRLQVQLRQKPLESANQLPPLPKRRMHSSMIRNSKNRRRERLQKKKEAKEAKEAAAAAASGAGAGGSHGVGGWIRRHISSARSTVTQSVAVPSTAAASLAASAAHGLLSGVENASSAAAEAVEITETAEFCLPDVHFEAGGDLRSVHHHPLPICCSFAAALVYICCSSFMFC